VPCSGDGGERFARYLMRIGINVFRKWRRKLKNRSSVQAQRRETVELELDVDLSFVGLDFVEEMYYFRVFFLIESCCIQKQLSAHQFSITNYISENRQIF
jgi:hypothetical protein